jgi:DNA-directed DNA polymerase III PolC
MPVSLHTHSWYSLLEGVSSPEALLARAAVAGYSALALTDTNNLYGAVAFKDKATPHDVRPVFGACLRQQRSRCVALIAERSGYRSLCRILSRLHQAVGPATPTPLADLLRDNAEGLHVLVEDVVLAERLREAFGRRLWLEVIRPRGGPDARRHERDLLACGRRLGIEPVASTAAHFATPADYPTFRLVTAIRQRTLLDRLPPTLAVTPEHHLVSADELRRRFRDLPGAVRNGDALAELLRSDVLPRDRILPEPQLSRPIPLDRYLYRLCARGLRRRGLEADLGARERLRQELAVIEPAGLTGYFLTVRDIARYARRRGHGMALRGSAGNSLVCYLLGITDVNPLRFGLPMERFLHPGRTDLPDIDLDFDWKVRDEVIDHALRRHGAAHAARISSHLFLQPRSAFREAAKIHGLSDEQVSHLLTTLAERVDDLLLEERMKDEGGRMKESQEDSSFILPPSSFILPSGFPLEPGRWPRIVADARRLLGRPHHLSIHPGGIVITPGPIDDYVPLQMSAKGVAITQLDKDAVEEIGLVKIDLLGNRALATVDEARRHAGVPRSDDTDDPATLALLQRGDTLGVNQLESPAMRHLLIQMRPRGVEDVIQSLALIRPGAAGRGVKNCFIRRRLGLEASRAAHPRLERLLAETHGLMIYEDDTLRLVQELTGLDAPGADRFRKRVARHKTQAEEQALAAEFFALCRSQGIAAGALHELWPQLAKFNYYAFCKSHAVSYGLLAWEAASLKVHHPVAFWTAALNNNQGCYPRRVYVEAIKRAGIPMLLPCVNRSADVFAPEGGAIRTGLGALAGLAAELRAALLDDRRRHGPYRSLADLRRRLQPGREALAALIRSGACDAFGKARPALFLEAELQDRTASHEPELFADGVTESWSPTDYPDVQRLWDEWQLLGFVVGPPLFSLFRRPGPPAPGPPVVKNHELAQHVGRTVRVEGLVATARYAWGKDDRPVQFISLEDESGLAEVTLFERECLPVPHLTMGPYVAAGVVDEQFGVVTLTARSFERQSAWPESAVFENGARPHL